MIVFEINKLEYVLKLRSPNKKKKKTITQMYMYIFNVLNRRIRVNSVQEKTTTIKELFLDTFWVTFVSR